MSSLRWMVRRYTDADVDLSNEELRRIEVRCNEIVVAHQWRMWIIMMLTASTSAAAGALGGRLLGPLVASATGFSKPICAAGCAMLAAAITATTWIYGYSFLYVRPLRRALSEMGYEVCVRCGYWLHSIDPKSTHCPECGTEREHRAT